MHLEPILMLPAYRCGKETPWGGDQLRRIYSKYAQAERVGCSLEISVTPGYESTSPDGRTLTDLITEYRADLLGNKIRGAFPFQIQLLDVREDLDVHVHPSRSCVSVEDVHSDSSEGLVILYADENAHIVCGLEKDVTLKALRERINAKEAITPCFHEISVKTNDTFTIPGGVPHAPGRGLILYAIQSAGAPAYRLCERKRPEVSGRSRPLQTEQAFEEMNKCSDSYSHNEFSQNEQTFTPVISSLNFTVTRISNACDLSFSNNPERFSVLTCLFPGEMKLSNGKTLYLAPGQTVLIPAMTCDFSLTCSQALLAEPKV